MSRWIAMQPIYFDNAATTPLLPAAADAVRRVSLGSANPASMHRAGQQARQILENAREDVAARLGADLSAAGGDRLVFTSGGTEANNLALFGLAGNVPGHLVTTHMEHPSVAKAADELERRGWHVDRLAPNEHGQVEVDTLAAAIRDDTRLVSVMLVSHETGVIQPTHELAALCARRRVPLHCDAVQAVGKLPVRFAESGVTALSFSGHKFHGPTGVGGLLLRRAADLAPRSFGGSQEGSLRPGTQPTGLIAGMQVALDASLDRLDAHTTQVTRLRDHFEARLAAAVPRIVVHGSAAPRSPYVSNVSLVGCDRQQMLMALDLAAVACSTGSACESGSAEPSPTLAAMGCGETLLGSAIRFSFSHLNTLAEVDEAVTRIAAVCGRMAGENSARKAPQSTR
ncbi:MAG: cysteine desulfurase family protein [Pirellulales bacterium]